MAISSFFSRRSFMRIAGSVAALPLVAESTNVLAVDASARVPRLMGYRPGQHLPDANAVIISGNENPLGPSEAAIAAMDVGTRRGGRYHMESKFEVIEAFSRTFALKPGYVSLWPGSTPALDLALKLNIGPSRPLVVGDPSYESGPRAASDMKAPIVSVALTAKGAHDVRRMVAAAPNAGTFYIVNPNNPTGTMTPRADILWLLANKPAGSLVVVDEAYHHFSHDESVIDQVAADRDLMVTRTFSKIYGMAGLRAGLLISRPDYQERLGSLGPAVNINGAMGVSLATAKACTASVIDKTLIPKRRKINQDIREATLEWMDTRGYKYYPGSQANFFMVDVQRPGRDFAALMQRQSDVYIGRTWKSMPNYVRITVGTAAEMQKFRVAFAKAYDTAPSVAHRDLPYSAPSELDYAV